MADQVVLPEGQDSFKLNEVCKLANVQPYMLRFWGTEFEQLEASKSGTGQRLYSREQVELILEIRRLLFDEGLTIAGARKRIGALTGSPAAAAKPAEAADAADSAPAEQVAEPEPADEPVAEEADPAPLPPPKAARAARSEKPAAGNDLAPVLSTLRGVRDEIASILDDLRK